MAQVDRIYLVLRQNSPKVQIPVDAPQDLVVKMAREVDEKGLVQVFSEVFF